MLNAKASMSGRRESLNRCVSFDMVRWWLCVGRRWLQAMMIHANG
jgi:hypothetical protein